MINRVINREEEHRFTEVVEQVNILHAPDVRMPFGNFLTAYRALDMTTIEVDKGAQANVEILFRCGIPATVSGTTDFKLFFFLNTISTRIDASPISSISLTTVLVSGTSQTVDMRDCMAYLGDNTLYWCTGDNGNAQNGRVWKANYNSDTGVLSNTSSLATEVLTGIRGLWVDGVNDLLYYTTDNNLFKKVVISTGSKTQIASGLSNPKSLFLANTTSMYISLTGVGNIAKYNLVTDVASNVFGASNDYDWVDGHFDQDIVWYRRSSNVIMRQNDFSFLNEDSTWLTSPGNTANFFVDRVNQRLYYIDQSGSALKNVNYLAGDEKSAGALASPGNYIAFTLG